MRSPHDPHRHLERAVGWACVIVGSISLAVLVANPPAPPARPVYGPAAVGYRTAVTR